MLLHSRCVPVQGLHPSKDTAFASFEVMFDLEQILIFFLLILEEEEKRLHWWLLYLRLREDRGEVKLLSEPTVVIIS